jgi:hypothetical protein
MSVLSSIVMGVGGLAIAFAESGFSIDSACCCALGLTVNGGGHSQHRQINRCHLQVHPATH